MEKDHETMTPVTAQSDGPARDDDATERAPSRAATPAWFQRAAESIGLTPEQQDNLIQALGREFPVDQMLATVVEGVVASIVRSEGDGSTDDALMYGELVAVDVVLGAARVLLGDLVQAPRPTPPRRTIRIPAGARLVLDRDLDVERVHFDLGAELQCGPHSVHGVELHPGDGCAVVLRADPIRRFVAVTETTDPERDAASKRPVAI